MNIVVHMTECKPNSTIASARVAKFIANTLPDIMLVDTGNKCETAFAKYVEQGLDTLIIVNGPMAFCDFLGSLGDLVTLAKKVVWVQQDYTINPPAAVSKAESPFRKSFADRNLRPVYWSTVEKNIQTPRDHYVNWNQLTFELQPLPELADKPTLLYYGAFRAKRVNDFIKWFVKPMYDVVISTTPIRGKKFKELDSAIQIVQPFTSLADLPKCSATLYIEDERSHREFHSPANRFYEMLSAGIPIFFDYASIKMLAKAGINVPEKWTVKHSGELMNKLEVYDLKEMQAEQRALWGGVPYVQLLHNQVNDAWRKLNAL